MAIFFLRVLAVVAACAGLCGVGYANDPQPKADGPKPQENHWWTEIRLHEGAGLLGFSDDGKQLASGGGGEIRVLTVPDGKEVIRMQLPDKQAVWGAFADDGKHLVSVSPTDKKIRHWSLATGKQTNELDLPRARDVQWVIGFSANGKLVALKLAGSIVLVDVDAGKVTAEFVGAGPGETAFKVSGGGFSPDGKRFAAGTGKGQLAVWDVETGKRLAISPEPKFTTSNAFVHVQFSPDGRWLTTANGGTVNFPIQVWDAKTCELLAEPVKENGYTTCLSWTPDGTAIVTADHNGTLATDAATCRTVHKFAVPTTSYRAQVQYPARDGKHLVFFGNSSRTDDDPAPKGYSVFLAQMPEAKKPAPPKGELTPAELDALWADVLSPNKIRQEQIRVALSAATDTAIPYLVKKSPPATAAEVERVRKLIPELDADAPDARKRAQDALAAVAHRFEPLLRDALADAKPGEVKNRLTFLLGEAADKPPPPDLQAELRAVELLARLNTPEAVKHLRALAAGAPQSRVTKEAKAALGTLKR